MLKFTQKLILIPQKTAKHISYFKKYGFKYFKIDKTKRWQFTTYEFFKPHGFIFIHIPKTAGISIFNSLFNTDSKGHIPFSDFEELIEKKSNIKTVSFVRNPIHRFESAYYYLLKGGRNNKYDLEYQKIISEYKDINDFVKNGLEKNLKIDHLIPQYGVSTFVVTKN